MPKMKNSEDTKTKPVAKKSKLELALKAFSALSPDEKQVFSKTVMTTEETIDALAIENFAKEHQRLYSDNISFTKARVKQDKLTASLLVSITLITAFGNFTGSGKNQKQAKLEAVSKALKEIH